MPTPKSAERRRGETVHMRKASAPAQAPLIESRKQSREMTGCQQTTCQNVGVYSGKEGLSTLETADDSFVGWLVRKLDFSDGQDILD